MIRVEVLYFAQLKEAMRVDRETIGVEEGASVQDVLRLIGERPEWTSVRALPLSFAVNEEIVDRTRSLRDGDRLALLPPVSGG
jgi:molybdopterin converting factor subunit 1